jgi:hypothetical protein
VHGIFPRIDHDRVRNPVCQKSVPGGRRIASTKYAAPAYPDAIMQLVSWVTLKTGGSDQAYWNVQSHVTSSRETPHARGKFLNSTGTDSAYRFRPTTRRAAAATSLASKPYLSSNSSGDADSA